MSVSYRLAFPPGSIYRVGTVPTRDDWRDHVAGVYCDGGSISANPSYIGGTYAWCAVDAQNEHLHAEYGWFTPPAYNDGGRELVKTEVGTVATSGNNQSEMLAVLMALREIRPSHPTIPLMIRTDNLLTINRLTKNYKLKGIPHRWAHMIGVYLRMPGTLRFQLLDGHPTRVQLEAQAADQTKGYGKRGNFVSRHNEFVDKLCGDAAKAVKLLMNGNKEGGKCGTLIDIDYRTAE